MEIVLIVLASGATLVACGSLGASVFTYKKVENAVKMMSNTKSAVDIENKVMQEKGADGSTKTEKTQKIHIDKFDMNTMHSKDTDYQTTENATSKVIGQGITATMTAIAPPPSVVASVLNTGINAAKDVGVAAINNKSKKAEDKNSSLKVEEVKEEDPKLKGIEGKKEETDNNITTVSTNIAKDAKGDDVAVTVNDIVDTVTATGDNSNVTDA